MSSIEVRKVVNKDDLQLAFHVREEVFMNEQKVSREDEYDGLDDDSVHYLGVIGDQVGGTLRWRKTDEGIKLERIAVLPAFRRKGLARKMLQQALKDIFLIKSADEKIYLHAQTTAISLYRSEGFVPKGAVFMECGIAHQTMEFEMS